jgi:DNA-binding NtrC family response regulator
MTGSENNRKRVLVIDDDESVRRLVTRALTRAGHTVRGADDGVHAIQRLKSESYDVVILDLAMPRVDGFAVLHYLRESDPYMLRRVIVLTGQSPEAVNGDPIFSVIRKPFSMDRLIAEVAVCCEKTAAHGPLIPEPAVEKKDPRPLTRIVQRLIGRTDGARDHT